MTYIIYGFGLGIDFFLQIFEYTAFLKGPLGGLKEETKKSQLKLLTIQFIFHLFKCFFLI